MISGKGMTNRYGDFSVVKAAKETISPRPLTGKSFFFKEARQIWAVWSYVIYAIFGSSKPKLHNFNLNLTKFCTIGQISMLDM
jgi:hypothetical protein